MKKEKFEKHLVKTRLELQSDNETPERIEEILAQERAAFEDREYAFANFPGQWVGYMQGQRYVAKTQDELDDMLGAVSEIAFRVTERIPSAKQQNKPKVWVAFSEKGVNCIHKPTCLDGEDCLIKDSFAAYEELR